MKIKHLLPGAVLLLASGGAWAWSATYLDGQNWAITCADGTSHSYHGSSAGLDTVGPALCPGGIVDTGDPLPGPTWTLGNIHELEREASQRPAVRLEATTERVRESQ
ncbi:hypothetical protein [Halomonas sp. Y3]|uniref:hypothetical protein n=1 Tax=Halomonas sp. Y3 TaxID=2956797 RepID=UPI00209EBC93|nr:hypothetical protein [Halomonas sp. Y3]